jgi:hypothetical protein
LSGVRIRLWGRGQLFASDWKNSLAGFFFFFSPVTCEIQIRCSLLDGFTAMDVSEGAALGEGPRQTASVAALRQLLASTLVLKVGQVDLRPGSPSLDVGEHDFKTAIFACVR